MNRKNGNGRLPSDAGVGAGVTHPAAEAYPDDFSRVVDQGLALLNRGQYAVALAAFEHAAMLDPGNPIPWHNRGVALENLKRFPEALDAFVTATGLQPSYEPSWQGKGNILARLQRPDEALDAYAKAIELNPGAYESYHSKGLALAKLKKYPEALDAYAKAIELNPRAHESFHDKGVALELLQKYPEALGAYAASIDLEPEYEPSWQGKGNTLVRLQRPDEALDAYARAIELNPGAYASFHGKGVALEHLKRYPEALEAYAKATDLKPDYELSWQGKGNTLIKLQRPAEALDAFAKVVALNPHSADNWYNNGFILYRLRRFEEAVDCYRKSIELDPDRRFGYCDCGNALEESGRREEAIALMEQAIARDDKFAYAYHNLAHYLTMQGDYEAGRKAWKDAGKAYERAEAMEREKGNEEFFLYYGLLLHQELRDFHKAERAMKTGLSLNPDHVGLLDGMAGMYLDWMEEPSKKPSSPLLFDKARQCLEKAKKILAKAPISPRDPEDLRRLGELHLKLGDLEEAKDCLRQVVELEEKMGIPSPQSYASLASVLSKGGDHRQAIHHFEKARPQARADLKTWSGLADAYLKLDPGKSGQLEKAETEFRKILRIAPAHVESQIGLGEIYLAMAEGGEKEFYETASKHFDEAIKLSMSLRGSKTLSPKELAAVHYSSGYAKVMVFEESKLFRDEVPLKEAYKDFRRCVELDPDHCRAVLARDKLERRFSKFSGKWFAILASVFVIIPALGQFGVAQWKFLFAPYERITAVQYIALSFGSLIFIVVGFFLREIRKLKGAGIELEKGESVQTFASGSFGIRRSDPRGVPLS